MVQCDVCDEWYHYTCVGVTQDIEHEDWSCQECRNAQTTQQNLNQDEIPTTSKEKSAKESNLKPPSKAGSIKSLGSKHQTKALLELQLKKLEEEHALKKEEIKLKLEMLDKRFHILEQMNDVNNSEIDEQDATSKVNEWLHDKSNISQRECRHECALEAQAGAGNYTVNQQHEQQFIPEERSTPKHHERDSSRVLRSADYDRLTQDQLAARQVVPKDLPKFSGNPEEWPMFFSTYESTSNMCGYRNDENMIRLRNCLKDEAYAAVQSFLMHPSTLPKAISVLKLRFGQPHTIINTLKKKISAMPSVRPDAMDKLIDFALAVQNLCATIEACQCKEYMNDASFLQELIGKLPPTLRLEWARSNRTVVQGSLEIFSSWMYSIAEDACLIVEPKHMNDRVHQTDPKKGKTYINTHSERPSSTDASTQYTSNTNIATERSKIETCIACKGNCESLEKCTRFNTQSYDAKWGLIREARLCRKCLRQHKGGCYSKPCGINGCTFKHHPLLHKQWSPRYDTNHVDNENQSEAQNCHTHQLSTNCTLLRYLPVVLHGVDKDLRCYAFLDEGSGSTLLDKKAASILGLQGEIKPLCLQWTGGMQRYEANSQKVSLDISGCDKKRYNLEDVRTVEDLRLPFQTLNVSELKDKHSYLRDLPIESYENIRPNILIGLKHANVMLVRKSREGNNNQPIAIKTRLGWTVYGGNSNDVELHMIHYSFHVSPCSCNTHDNLHQTVKQYFSLEAMGITKPSQSLMSNEDKHALHLLESLTQFSGERYETGLLWRHDEIRLPDSKALAQRRLYCLEKRMEKDPELKRIMQGKIAEYIEKKIHPEINR
ncbi:uncharacterized protein LOC129773204 [Toxorhynchites rutilus septentrionalis]|uniref:uncharacterized protein LOC129773204 n=1 Tax=Toxorhynchites rutilus septentrionalis TaxID=329112 RepID=UPI002478CF71|nr:uncharacterized protein LOC129773204 [Toxorhynchites rutilus septentrionalis]